MTKFKHTRTILIYVFILLININVINSDEKCMGKEHTPDSDEQNLRLPNDTIPIAYDITLSIDEISKTYSGLTNIEIIVLETTKTITLHSKDLYIRKVTVTDLSFENNDNEDNQVKNIIYELDDLNKTTNFLKIYSEDNDFEFTQSNKYLISIKFEGDVNENSPEGVYLSENEKDENSIPIIGTQFEPNFARTAFPCYDEPHLKAKFTLTLIHSSIYTALSNMPVDGKPIEDIPMENSIIYNNSIEINDIFALSKTTTKFQQSPLMSTYLLAIVLHNYHSTSVTVNNVTHSVYYPNSKSKPQADYTLKKSVEILTLLEEYFKVRFPLPKLDHIGLPSAYGNAMENWGLIIYNHEKLLLDPDCKNNTKAMSNIEVMKTIAHEIVHQWFGNLVTLKWWSYVWLNEGFATYYSYLVMQKVFGECIHDYYYHSDSLTSAFDYHCKRPLTFYKLHEANLETAFDAVSYHRGAAIIKMIKESLTEPTFRKGINNYLDKFKFASSTEDDLIECLEKAAIEDNHEFFKEPGFLTNFIKTWTQNHGYPQIQIHRDLSTNELTFQQKPSSEGYDKYWYIPISLVTSSTSSSPSMLTMGENENKIHFDLILPAVENYTLNLSEIEQTKNLTENDWIIINDNMKGLFNVHYNEEDWNTLLNALKTNSSSISVLNRQQILRNLLSALKRDEINFDLLLETFSYLKSETDPLIWLGVIDELEELNAKFSHCKIYSKFKKILHDILEPITKSVLDTESKIDEIYYTTNMQRLVQLACDMEVSECIPYGANVIKCLSDPKYEIEDCIESAKFFTCSVVKTLPTSVFKKFAIKAYEAEAVNKFKVISAILKCTNDPRHIKILFYDVFAKHLNKSFKQRIILEQTIMDIAKSNKDNMKNVFQYLLNSLHDIKTSPIAMRNFLMTPMKKGHYELGSDDYVQFTKDEKLVEKFCDESKMQGLLNY